MANAQGVAVVQAPVQPAIVLKPLSKWATRGLDLAEAGFSKLHSQECKYNDDKPKYELQPDKFEVWKNELIEKINRMHAVAVFTGVDETNANRFLLKEYTLLTEDNVEDMRELAWPQQQNQQFTTQEAADNFTDRQIKASCIGTYIHASLSEAAKKQLRADQDHFTVQDFDGNDYFDGPTYFYYIASLVDPDNTHMIENVRRQLRTLDVKDYNFSVIKMLSEFKLLVQKIDELGGTYDIEDQYLDFWDCLKTMKEKEFCRYVRQEKDAYRKLTRANRPNLDVYIRDMTKKEVAMKEDKEWNVMSAEDTMIMALVNTLETKGKASKSDKDKTKKKASKDKSKKDKDKDKDTSELSDAEKQKRRDARIPDWKKESPKKDESKSKEKDSKTYHWCSKCRQGKGLWALHKDADHSTTWKPETRSKDTKKQVSYSTDTKKSDDDEPAMTVNKKLLANAKAYLANFSNSDFQAGGTTGP